MTLADIIKNEKLNKTQLAERFEGMKVRVVKAQNSHDYGPKGTIHTIENLIPSGITSTSFVRTSGSMGNSIRFSNLEIVATTKEEISKNISNLEKLVTKAKKAVKDEEDKLKVMEELGLETYDKEVIRIHKIVQIIKGESDDVTMAKAIAVMMKS